MDQLLTFTFYKKENAIKDHIDIEIKHYMGDRSICAMSVNIKATIPQILEEFWKLNDKLKGLFGAKGIYATSVS